MGLYEYFEDNMSVHLILDLSSGGDLVDRLLEAMCFTEAQAGILMQQMLGAVSYLHERRVIHRDLKPGSWQFVTKEKVENDILKLTDFDFACEFADGQKFTTKAGTPYYMSPEMIAGSYDNSTDLWTMGAMMYVLLCGYPAFCAETDDEVFSKVKEGTKSFDDKYWKDVSEDAKNLTGMLLKINPSDRYTAQQALNHAWVKNPPSS